jgi:hypothetical protein
VGEDVVEGLDHGTPDLLYDPLAIDHAAIDCIDSPIAKLGMIVADIDNDDAARNIHKQRPGKIGNGLRRIAMMMISLSLAASTMETGIAPISAANEVRLSGPLEFAIET